MSAPRQQPTTRNRRVFRRGASGQPQDAPWEVREVREHEVDIEIYATPEALIPTGTPPFTNLNTGNVPTGYSLAGVLLTLTFSEVLALPLTLKLLTGSPGITTIWGGYLAAGVVTITSPVWPPAVLPQAAWTVDTVVGNTCVIHLTGGGGNVYDNGLPQFKNETSGEFPTSIVWTATDGLATFATAPVAGDVMSYPYGNLSVWSDNAKIPEAKLATIA